MWEGTYDNVVVAHVLCAIVLYIESPATAQTSESNSVFKMPPGPGNKDQQAQWRQ